MKGRSRAFDPGPLPLFGDWMPSQHRTSPSFYCRTLTQSSLALWSGSCLEMLWSWEGSLGAFLVCLVIFTVVTCKLLVTIFYLKDVPLQSQLQCLFTTYSLFSFLLSSLSIQYSFWLIEIWQIIQLEIKVHLNLSIFRFQIIGSSITCNWQIWTEYDPDGYCSLVPLSRLWFW